MPRLRIRSNDISRDSLSRLSVVADAARSRSHNFEAVAYGTPEMAYEIIRLFKGSDVRSKKIFVMAGHRGGILSLSGKILKTHLMF